MLQPLVACLQPGCPARVRRGRCARHAGRVNSIVRRWYYTARWGRLRLRVLLEQAYACASCGRVVVDLDVDHIRPHEGSPGLFWDRQNLQGLCKVCHTRKTRKGE